MFREHYENEEPENDKNGLDFIDEAEPTSFIDMVHTEEVMVPLNLAISQ